MTNARLKREALFFDNQFFDNFRVRRTRKFYSVNTAAAQHFRALASENCTGKKVLEYGCGQGRHALALARQGADVVGIDISAEGIQQARTLARDEGLEGNLSFEVMNAERLEFPDNYFDIVCGNSILHHLDLDNTCNELVRILKPDGRAVFREPLGHNLLINFYRQLTPEMRTVDEHPLLASDLENLARYFHETRVHYYALCTLLAVPLRSLPGFKKVVSVLEYFDRILLRLPFLKKQAWLVVIQLDRPLSSIAIRTVNKTP